MLSTDASVTLMGATYNPTSLQCVSAATTITLPPDCLEVVKILPVSQTLLDRQVQFVPASPTSSEYVNAERAGTIETATVYYYHIRGRTILEVATPFTETFEVRLQYAALESPIEATDTIVLLPDWILPAVLMYGQYRALQSIKHPDYLRTLQTFDDTMSKLIQLSKPRFSQTIETVEGVFDRHDNNLGVITSLW